MARPNQAFLLFSTAQLHQSIRWQFQNSTESDLYQVFDRILPNQRERQLDNMFANTINQIVIGYAFRRKVLNSTGMSSFGPALNNLPQYDHIQDREKVRLCARISRIKTVYENWDVITHNLTNPRMIFVEARKFSIDQLARCITFKWVNDYNEKHSTQRRNGNAVNQEYPDHMIQEIMRTVENCGIVQHVNGDPDQLKLIGKDIVNRMLNMN